jgi:hypothetical protein
MEELATAIVDATVLLRDLIDGATAQGNVAAADQGEVWESISSIVQNLAAFVTELAGQIAGKL